MEFTKDDYVVEGDLEVSVDYLKGESVTGSASKVTIKGDWLIVESTLDFCVFNRDSIRALVVKFKEG